MLELFHGRIDRKTYIFGNLIALGVLAVACAIYVLPIAVLDLIINQSRGSDLFRFLYRLVAILGVAYYFYFTVLMVKRFHDIGYPGIIWVFLFTLAQFLGRMLDLWPLNAASLALIALLCLVPGQKARNQFGNKTPKHFKLTNLRPHV